MKAKKQAKATKPSNPPSADRINWDSKEMKDLINGSYTGPPEPPYLSCQVRLSYRKAGRWSLTADETSMRCICSMIRNSTITPRNTPPGMTRDIARRVLRTIKNAGVF
jgi:hypothetical protein